MHFARPLHDDAQPICGCPAPPPAPPATPDPTPPQLSLAVWPPSNPSLLDSYLSASQGQHRIPPQLAARAILAYTDPGELVLDPCCAVGSVLVEAIRHGRSAIGITSNSPLGALAVANISHARDQGAPGRAAVLEGNPKQLPRLLTKAAAILNTEPGPRKLQRHPAGSTQLILTVTPAGELPELLHVLRTVLAPGGFLLLALEQHDRATRIGLGATVAVVEEGGLHYWQHVIALRSPTTAPRSERTPLLHTDLLAFRKPAPARINNVARQAASA